MIYAYHRLSQCDIVLSRERVPELSGLSSCLERILKILRPHRTAFLCICWLGVSRKFSMTWNCRISCVGYWSLCEQRLYRFKLLTGRVFKIVETMHGKLCCHRRCQCPYPHRYSDISLPLVTPIAFRDLIRVCSVVRKEWRRPNTYHCDWWRDSHSLTLHIYALISTNYYVLQMQTEAENHA